MCDEEGQCLNTWVTAQPRGATVRFSVGTQEPTVYNQPAPAAPAAPVKTASPVAKKPSDMLVVNRPAAGSLTGRVWDIADDYATQQIDYGSKTFRKEVIARCEAAGLNKSTASVQFGKWISSKS